LEGGIKTQEAWGAIKKWWNSSTSDLGSRLAYSWYTAAGIPANEEKKYSKGDLVSSFWEAIGRASMDYHSGALMSGGGLEYHSTPQAPKAAVVTETAQPTFKITDGAVIVSQLVRAKKFTAQTDPAIFKSFNTEIIDGKGPVTGQFDYIVGLDDQLKIGFGHFKLSNGELYVRTAGGLSIKQGVVKLKTNDTGHDLPTVEEGKNGLIY
jgi:hypothetical protein